MLALLLVTTSTPSLVAPTKPLPPLRSAVIVPGFLSAASDFTELAAALTAEGLPTTVVPLSVLDWLPMLGGRSVRPLLERIDHTVRHAAAGVEVPPFEYGLGDLWADFQSNPGGVLKAGGSDQPDEYPQYDPRGGSQAAAPPPVGRVALIGHSAGGFSSRIFLSDRTYGGSGGRAYGGSALVHSLVTLGTPHVEGAGVPFVTVGWANRETALPSGVRCLAVAATGTPGDSSGELTRGAYSFCTPSGEGGELLDGDGVTTTESALAFRGAETMTLDGVTHYPWTAPGPVADLVAPELTKAFREGKPWFGSDGVREKWSQWLLDGCVDGA